MQQHSTHIFIELTEPGLGREAVTVGVYLLNGQHPLYLQTPAWSLRVGTIQESGSLRQRKARQKESQGFVPVCMQHCKIKQNVGYNFETELHTESCQGDTKKYSILYPNLYNSLSIVHNKIHHSKWAKYMVFCYHETAICIKLLIITN